MNEISFSSKRLLRLIFSGLLSLLLPAICGMLRGMRLDMILVWCFLGGICTLCFFIYIEEERLHSYSGMDSGCDFSMLLLIYLIGLLLSCVFAFFPAYTAPVLFLSVLFSGTFPSKTGIILAVYFAMLTAIFSDNAVYLYLSAAYVTLAVVGALLSDLSMRKGLYLWTAILMISLSAVIPACCCYLDIHALRPQLFAIVLPAGIVCAISLRAMPRLRDRIYHTQEISLTSIMDEHYHLRRQVAQYSTIDYEHALRVSDISAKIAEKLGADVSLARAGGFYYRIGRLEGEPYAKNGVRLAQENCFPSRLVRILEEYNGILSLPSSIESAIVSISDMIVTKLELLDKDTFLTGWNREMVIYQSMNEKSSEGFYDACNMSMNQFLKIRDLLVKEELLL